MALLVTVICIVLAVPLALYMAKVASPRMRLLLVIAVTTPLWASYLVKAYAWRMLLSPEGPLAWAQRLHAGIRSGGDGDHADLSVAAVHDHPGVRGIRPGARLADRRQFRPRRLRLLDDCGWWWRRWCFPVSRPGSIFTFSLSLGDYIAVTIVGGKTQLLGNVIYGQLVTANNQPLAAALSIIPLAAIILYLLAMRRTGALENV